MDTAENISSDDEGFYFESDELALRGNKDYSNVLKTIAILQAQRIRATHDLENLAIAKTKALQEPEKFLETLKSGGNLDLPGRINIQKLPSVNFEKYDVVFPNHMTENGETDTQNFDMIVRGRLFDQTKPETFNQLWTREEQRRLEELLIEYPPEPVESHRFSKIAKALGNRTTTQVASRVQKYFKKLHSAGMPVPGRIPKSYYKNQKLSKFSLKPTTFFPAHDVPVAMPEDDDFSDDNTFEKKFQDKKLNTTNNIIKYEKEDLKFKTIVIDQASDDEDNINHNKIENKLKLLLRIRKDKEKDNLERSSSKHFDYKCDLCKEEPICGTRWHCITCTSKDINYCSDCLITNLLSNQPHSFDHKFNALRVIPTNMANQMIFNTFSIKSDINDNENEEESENNLDSNIYDKDYLPSKFCEDKQYNYMDPNFMPN